MVASPPFFAAHHAMLKKDSFEGRRNSAGKIISSLLRREVTTVKPNGPRNKLALCPASIAAVMLLYLLQGLLVDPQRKPGFFLFQRSKPPISVAMTHCFSLSFRAL